MKRAAMEFETLVKIILVLFAMAMIIYFLTGGIRGFGNPIASISRTVAGGEQEASKAILG